MFTNEDILTLAKAGFTANQIAALNTVQPAEKAPQEQPQPAAQEVPAEPVKAAEPVKEEPKKDDAVISKLDEMINTFRTSAINHSQQPQAESVDDILASIINPPAFNK